jgi:hypothetical protein
MTSLIAMAAAASARSDFSGYFFTPELGQRIALGGYIAASLAAIGIAVYKHADFKGVLSDKAMSAPPTALNESAPTSFSRLAGLLGILYLTAFLWGIGFFVLTYIWVAPDTIGKVISDSGQFLMAGSALFAPYAFNQLSQVFSTKAGDNKSAPVANLPTSDDIKRALTPRG